MRDFKAQILAQGDAVKTLGEQGILSALENVVRAEGGFYQMKCGGALATYQWGVTRETLKRIMDAGRIVFSLVEAFRKAEANEAADTGRAQREFSVFVPGYKNEVRVKLERLEVAC